MITKEMIKAIAPRSKDSVVNPLIAHLNRYLPDYGVTTHLRIVHFLAQAAHESDSFKTLEEYASGIKYENRKDLGNVRQGDGKRYKGRGIFQLTGRANYRVIGQKIGVDLENNPELAETHKISVLTALEYWKSRGLNKFADADDVKTITKRINGGYNGFEDRKNYLAKAKSVIPKNIKFDTPTPVPVPVPPPVVAPPPPVVVLDEYPVLDLSNMPPPPINPIIPPIVVANLGDNSPYINDLKDMLIRKGYKITDDDNYDLATENAVKNFQSQLGLPVTGEIDTDTLNRMMV
jgi:putative chitinase